MLSVAWCCVAVLPAGDPGFAEARAFVQQRCVQCHGAKKHEADLDLERFGDEAAALKGIDAWENALKQVKDGAMPPPKQPRPTPAEIERFAQAVQALAAKAPPPKELDPGRVTMRRLNRAEYNNTMRDLLGVDLRPADAFPVDDSGYGFDNNGDVLSLAPALLEKYLAAAEACVAAALEPPGEPLAGPEVLRRFTGRELRNDGEVQRVKGKLERRLVTNGQFFVEFSVPSPGKYRFTARAFQDAAGNEAAKMPLRVDDRDLQTFDVTGTEKAPKNYSVEVDLTAGKHKFAAAFVNDYFDAKAPDPARRDRNLGLSHIELVGPVGSKPKPREPSEAYRRIMLAAPNGKNDKEVAARILRNFARQAYRRPPQNSEADRLLFVYIAARKAGDDFPTALKAALAAALVSPKFLFRVEFDHGDGVYEVAPFELASRLSYFLWSSMPDEELFRLAQEDRLKDPDLLAQQVRRMLADPKSQGFVENFAGQWLQTRNLAAISPDPGTFKDWNDELRRGFATETEMFFAAMLKDQRDLGEFLDGRFTFVNGPLAKHYGIPGVYGKEFRRVSLQGTPRAGLLTQGSFLAVTSNPTRTSPVKRGKWILENLLASPPPPPPPDVPELEKEELKGTLRQRMEQHRANAVCASCHQRMDPLGMAFENFDGIGGYRDRDAGQPVDASGTLPSGEKFAGPAELQRILKGRRDQFRRCLAEKLLTYALGRGLERSDRYAVDTICKQAAARGDHLAALVVETALSEPFRKRKAGEKP